MRNQQENEKSAGMTPLLERDFSDWSGIDDSFFLQFSIFTVLASPRDKPRWRHGMTSWVERSKDNIVNKILSLDRNLNAEVIDL